jgi:hypothetical protein
MCKTAPGSIDIKPMISYPHAPDLVIQYLKI